MVFLKEHQLRLTNYRIRNQIKKLYFPSSINVFYFQVDF